MRLFPEAAETLVQLRANGFTLGICSNLAQPYSAPLRALLPFEMDAYVWSFEVGAIKPSPIIFQAACEALQVKPDEIFHLFRKHYFPGFSIKSPQLNGVLLASLDVKTSRVQKKGRSSRSIGETSSSLLFLRFR